MLCLRGAPALSDFRLVKLTARLREAGFADGDLYAVIRSRTELPQKLWDLVWNDDIGLPDLAVKEVEISELIGVGATNDLFDEAEFPPQTQIYVSQDIFVWATDPAETARLLGFEQRFSQVPVPSTLILLFGSVLFAGFAHRRLLG